MYRPALIVLASVLGSVSSVGEAADDDRFAVQRPYIQLSAGGSVGGSESYAAFELAGGVDLKRNIGAELGFVTVTDIFFTDIDIVYLSIVGKYPLAAKARVAGKAGVARWTSRIEELFAPNTEDDGVNAMFGIEVQLDLLSKLAVVLSLEHYGSINVGATRGDESISPATLGLRLTF